MFLTGYEPRFHRGARIGNLRGPRAGAAAGDFYTKLLSFILIFHNAPQLYFDFVSDPTTQLGAAIQGPNTDSDGCFLQHRDRDSGSSCIYYIFQHRLGRVCLLVCLFVCLSVCSGLFVSLFSVLYSTTTETRVGHLSTIRCRNRSALESSGRHGERGVQQHPGGHQELPRLCLQEQGVVSRLQEQAVRLPVSLQQGRIRSVSRQGPATILYSRQHGHRHA